MKLSEIELKFINDGVYQLSRQYKVEEFAPDFVGFYDNEWMSKVWGECLIVSPLEFHRLSSMTIKTRTQEEERKLTKSKRFYKEFKEGLDHETIRQITALNKISNKDKLIAEIESFKQYETDEWISARLPIISEQCFQVYQHYLLGTPCDQLCTLLHITNKTLNYIVGALYEIKLLLPAKPHEKSFWWMPPISYDFLGEYNEKWGYRANTGTPENSPEEGDK